MLKSIKFLSLLVMCAAVVGCNNPFNKSVTDLDRMQGQWKASVMPGTEFTIDIKGNELTLNGPQGMNYVGTLKLDETTTPKSADFLVNKCNEKRYVGTVSKAIYKLEGDHLTMVGTEPGSGLRPTVLKASSQALLLTFLRVNQVNETKGNL